MIDVPAERRGAFSEAWRYCIGSEHLGLALHREYLEHLELVQREIGFRYLRGHGILSDQVGVYREQAWTGSGETMRDEAGFLNFTYVDRIYDALLEREIRPFVELGFMPADLASGEKTCFWWSARVSPPKDYGQWRRLVREFVRHLVGRYGLDEVRRWPFEIWNEPDAANFWAGDQADYFRLYRETVTAVKDVDAALQVGGPATCPASPHWIPPFLEMCATTGTPVDFVSHHAYMGKPLERFRDFSHQDLHDDPRSLVRQMERARSLVRASRFPALPVHITEFNTSYNAKTPIHDSCYNAALLARVIAEAGDHVDSLAYWAFSDVFVEQDIPRSQFHGGFGLVALNGIRKPVFHLFAFCARLGHAVHHRDRHMLVTRRSRDGAWCILAWNDVAAPGLGGDLDFEVTLPLTGDAFLQRRWVDREHGNPWRVWRDMGRPRWPRPGQVAILRAAAEPGLDTAVLRPREDGRCELRFRLGRNAISLVEIVAREDESASYAGLNDDRTPE
ncbi:MAG TPA: glycosyl hydrolase [Opitutaceae bacterium]|nr:glycosyl hydrolase [Opitutaceae bacterium]